MGVNVEALRVVPYLLPDVIEGRHVPLFSLWDGQKWLLWVDGPSNSLMQIKTSGLAQGPYFATQPQAPTDISLPIFSFIWKRASFRDVVRPILGLENDIANLCASLAKLNLFHRLYNEQKLQIEQFAVTELEYVLVVLRSTLDLLQELAVDIWRNVRLLDPAMQRRKRDLPKSFREVVLKNGVPLQAEKIAEKYSLPLSIADAYYSAAELLITVRGARDAVVHRGVSMEYIFPTERGFCISRNARFFGNLPIWKSADCYNENLVSLRALLGHLIGTTFTVLNTFSERFMQSIQFPSDLAPAHNLYYRFYHAVDLLDILEVGRGDSPWIAPTTTERSLDIR